MKNFRNFSILSIIAFASASLAGAAVWLPKIFSDGMVLQRDMPVKVWGTAAPNAEIAVSFDSQTQKVKADAKGEWSLLLKPMKANSEPRGMSISENGKLGAEVKNILVGEVWIAGGQSNMHFPMRNSDDYKKALARANYPQMRVFTQNQYNIAALPQRDTDKASKWNAVEPKSIHEFCAVAYYFGEKLMKDLNVPVGIIETPLGGATMRAYIPADKMGGIGFLEARRAQFAKELAAYDYKKSFADWEARMAAHKAEEKKAAAEGKKIPELSWREKLMPLELTPWSSMETPAYLYNAKIAPIAGYSARGVVWYQGEGDSGGTSLKDFQAQFTRLIESWRAAWGDDKLYFIFVQLASYGTKAEWPETRWAQYNTMLSVPRTGMANIIDCGDEKDIHPKDKTTVGLRLAGIALKDVYGDNKVHHYGPMFKMIRYGDKGAEVVFNLDGRKLVGKGEGRGFEVLVGGKWVAAKAELCGNRVFVNPADGSNAKIEGVRYLWKNWARPDVWLYNQDGLPALSFISVR